MSAKSKSDLELFLMWQYKLVIRGKSSIMMLYSLTFKMISFDRIVGGTVYRSVVKEKKEAQRTYDKAKEKGQTAGQVKQK